MFSDYQDEFSEERTVCLDDMIIYKEKLQKIRNKNSTVNQEFAS